MFTLWCRNVCARGTETFHPNAMLLGPLRSNSPLALHSLLWWDITHSSFEQPLACHSQGLRKSDEVLKSCASSDRPKNVRQARHTVGTTGSHCHCPGAAVVMLAIVVVGLDKLVLPIRPFVSVSRKN